MKPYVRSTILAVAAVPLLATWLAVGGCGDGRSGFVLVLHALGYSVTASYCHV